MDLLKELVFAWNSRYPLVWLISWDEARVEDRLRRFAQKITGQADAFRTWSLSHRDESLPADPLRLLESLATVHQPAVFLIKDLPDLLDGQPQLIRRCRDLYYALRKSPVLIVLMTSHRPLPENLRREFYLIPVDIPSAAEIQAYLEALFGSHSNLKPLKSAIPTLAPAVRGLTFNEIFHLVNRIARSQIRTDDELLELVFREKEQVVRKESVLEFIPPRWTIDDIGGLDLLKDWLKKRARLFTPDARKAGLPCPKGILVMGISGCGKSLAVKAISALWKLPLFRLDMNLVFAGVGGDPEWTFYRALKQVEAMAPAVLWFDEIEMGVGRYHETGAEGRSHLFSTFLTWMQEREGDVFIAATANRIHLLPAELLRKGRFDQIFYVDLPENEERKEIFRIHLAKQGQDPSRFDLVALAAMTQNWTGAEIEQAVISARIEALNENREMTMDDLITAIGQIVPLAKTMEDQIKAIKSWAYDRAMPASSHASRRYR